MDLGAAASSVLRSNSRAGGYGPRIGRNVIIGEAPSGLAGTAEMPLFRLQAAGIPLTLIGSER